MAIPGYQEFMLPLMQIAADGGEHTIAEAMETLAVRMGITEEDQTLLLPSGTQSRYYNRVTWAVTYLMKSGLLDRTGRGRFKITARGVEVLRRKPVRIDNHFLDQFEEYRQFKTKRAEKAANTLDTTIPSSAADPEITPEERLEAAYQELRDALADDLQERVRAGTPKFFA